MRTFCDTQSLFQRHSHLRHKIVKIVERRRIAEIDQINRLTALPLQNPSLKSAGLESHPTLARPPETPHAALLEDRRNTWLHESTPPFIRETRPALCDAAKRSAYLVITLQALLRQKTIKACLHRAVILGAPACLTRIRASRPRKIHGTRYTPRRRSSGRRRDQIFEHVVYPWWTRKRDPLGTNRNILGMNLNTSNPDVRHRSRSYQGIGTKFGLERCSDADPSPYGRPRILLFQKTLISITLR